MQDYKPLIVQSDKTLLLDVHAPNADECRNALMPFAELERSPEHLHTYRLTPLSLWNAASVGFSPDYAIKVLTDFSRYDVPQIVCAWIKETAERFGKIRMIPDFFLAEELQRASEDSTQDAPQEKLPDTLLLETGSAKVAKEIEAQRTMMKYLTPVQDTREPAHDNIPKFLFRLAVTDRGTVKQELLKLGWPVKDEVPLRDGEPLEVSLKETASSGKALHIRKYQSEAAASLVGDKRPGTGFGTIVLPCGAGKTIVGMVIMDMLKTSTLILTTNISAVHQWVDELLDKTNLTRDQIGEYSGETKEIKPVTIATYQILTWRPEKEGPYPHFQIFRERPWGLIIYDEVHMLPAPVFRVTAELQATRRVGLTATLVREDGCEGYVFSLVGPKRYDVPWKELETSGWIADAECIEYRLDMPMEKELEYAVSGTRIKHRIASENPAKIPAVQEIVKRFSQDKILIIGQYLDQLYEIAELLKVPIITGKTNTSERDEIYSKFRKGEIRILVVSKVANFAIDLPDASMAIQVSGTFGSRQEEAQRLGRILRPKQRKARFITLISRGTVEEDFGTNRQKFLAEQGYTYKLIRALDELPDEIDCQTGGEYL
ncbi:MAG: DEAD/DEAH box helicase [Spirochaetaceae bacterium]|nr:DEAD/DEAH box helicase [Spirochaetaceae bacterium]